MLEQKGLASKAMKGEKASGRQTWSNNAGLAEDVSENELRCKAGLPNGSELVVSRAQQLQENRGWEMLKVEEALASLDLMAEQPSVATFVHISQKCRKEKNLVYARRVHKHISDKGLEGHRSLGNYLVPMFVECKSVSDAQQVFNGLVDRNEHSWTSLIQGYIECGDSQHALHLFKKMQEDCVYPSRYTFVALVKAYASLKCVERAREIHVEIAKRGLEKNLYVGSALVNMYANCDSLAEAMEVFDKLPVRNVVSWTALIQGYAVHGLGEEAVDCLEQMQVGDVSADATMFVSSLKACGSAGAIDKGREVHTEIVELGLEGDHFIGSTLVDMYSKCGSLADGLRVFDNLPIRNVVSWTALMAGYAHQGESELVFHFLERMRVEGIEPDGTAFLSVLSVCSHSGLVDWGQKYFEVMSKEYSIIPTIEHHNCIVDLLARAGQLQEAVVMLEKMPYEPNVVSWTTVLAACRKWGNLELSRYAFESSVRLDGTHAAGFVLMSNIYHMGEQED